MSKNEKPRSALLNGHTAKDMFSKLKAVQRADVQRLLTLCFSEDLSPDDQRTLKKLLANQTLIQNIIEELASGNYQAAVTIINTQLTRRDT